MSDGTARQDVEGFIADLERELREKKLTLLDSEILVALESKEATRAQICQWAKAFYAATRHGRMAIGNFYANAPDDDELRRELAQDIYEEETGRISGIGDEEAKKLPAPSGDHVPQGSPIPPDEYCVALSTYGFSDRQVRWFTMHAELDADHGEEFRRHARKVAAQPGGLEILRERTITFAQIVKNIWNGHGSWEGLAS